MKQLILQQLLVTSSTTSADGDNTLEEIDELEED